MALVAGSKGGFAELLHGDKGGGGRALWLNTVLAVRRVGRVQPKAMAGMLTALAEARRPTELLLLEELRDVFPALLADTTPAYIGGVWRPAIQVRADLFGWKGGSTEG